MGGSESEIRYVDIRMREGNRWIKSEALIVRRKKNVEG